MSQLIAIDPGGETGIAILGGYPANTKITAFEINFPDHHTVLWHTLDALEPDHIICEAFDWRPHRKRKVELISRNYIGIIELYCMMNDDTTLLHMQSPPQKEWWTDDKLKRVGEYLPGKPHANDAVRHLLYWIMQSGDERWLHALRGMGRDSS